MAGFTEYIKKHSKVQNEITQTIEKYINESYATQSRTRQNASVQNKNSEQVINIKGETQSKICIKK